MVDKTKTLKSANSVARSYFPAQRSDNYELIESSNTDFVKWASETGDRLQIASVSVLFVGVLAFFLATCLILYEDRWVAKIASKFQNLIYSLDCEMIICLPFITICTFYNVHSVPRNTKINR